MKKYIRSAVDFTVTPTVLGETISSIYARFFPHSRCSVSFLKNLAHGCSLDVQCFMAASPDELCYGHWDTDLFNISLMVKFKDAPNTFIQDDAIVGKLQLDFYSSTVKCASRLSSYTAKYSIAPLNIPLHRDSVGDSDRILGTWEQYVSDVYDTTVQLYQNGLLYKEPLKYYDIEEKLRLK